MTKQQDVKFSNFPGRNTPLLDRPFGNASPGCFVFARNIEGLDLNFPAVVNELEAADESYSRDGAQWSLGNVATPLVIRRYSTLDKEQIKLANEIVRGSVEHLAILRALGDSDLRNIPSRVGIEATVILKGEKFIVGNHTDRRVNPTRSPIPYSGFAVSPNSNSLTVEEQIREALKDMFYKQFGLSLDTDNDRIKIHTIYTLGRRLQTQIACTVDLRDTDFIKDDFVRGSAAAVEGHAAETGRHSGLEFLDWNEDTINRFASSHSFRSTKQNLSSVFLAAAADGIISEEKAMEYIGARSAFTELEIARIPELNELLHHSSFSEPQPVDLGPAR